MSKKAIVLGTLVGGFVGIMIGSTAGADTATQATPAPTPQVKTVTKEVTPQACKDLIATDNDILNSIGSALGSYGSNMTDPTPLVAATAHIKAMTPTRLQQVSECEGQ